MWQMWQMSQNLRKTPADLLGITASAPSFYFNKAVWTFGTTLEADLNAVAEKSKKASTTKARQTQVMVTWMGTGSTKGLYRDPAAKRSV